MKARLCPKCSEKLNYGTRKRQVVQKKRAVRKWEKERKRTKKDEEEDDDVELNQHEAKNQETKGAILFKTKF